jgi:lipopolysaccharide transport system ATP-binding protein
MADCVIRVENLGKLYRIGASQPRYKTIRESVNEYAVAQLHRIRTAFLRPGTLHSQRFDGDNTIWALRNISFEVNQGEVVGIIGRNGAGKSTLLKILSRVTKPTEGAVDLYGRVGSLLEVGTGFHPELTGRENIFLNGALLGMKKAEIHRKFDEIVAFAEVERFLDTPVKHYSSGMYVRLAFAVAAHLEQEILLVDEVLAVGDAAFQEKCLGKLSEVSRCGRTVLLVSHNLASVTALCGRAVLLEAGRIETEGAPQTVVTRYLSGRRRLSAIPLKERTDRQGDGRLRITGAFLWSGVDRATQVAASGEDLIFEIEYVGCDETPIHNVVMTIALYGPDGRFLFLCGNEMAGTRFERLPHRGRLVCRIPRLPLSPGVYDFNLHCTVNGILADWVQQAGRLTVAHGDFFGTGRLPPASHGGFLVPHEWTAGE